MKKIITLVLKKKNKKEEVDIIFKQNKENEITFFFEKDITYKNKKVQTVKVNPDDQIENLTAYLYSFFLILQKENEQIYAFYYDEIKEVKIKEKAPLIQYYINGNPVGSDTDLVITLKKGENKAPFQEDFFEKINVKDIKNTHYKDMFKIDEIELKHKTKEGIPQYTKSQEINKILFYSCIDNKKIAKATTEINQLLPYLKEITAIAYQLEYYEINLSKLTECFLTNIKTFRCEKQRKHFLFPIIQELLTNKHIYKSDVFIKMNPNFFRDRH